MVSVLVADDHRVFAEALGQLLAAQPDITVVGSVATAPATVEFLRLQEVDVLVLDVELGDDSGIEMLAGMHKGGIDIPTVVLSCHNRVDIALDALRAGALAYVTKDASFEDLLSAIRAASKNESWMSPRVLTPVLHTLLHPSQPRAEAEARLALLSPRELEVLECLVSGMTQAAIGATLFLSPNTVRTHIRNLLGKLEARSSLEAVGLALKAGVRPREESTGTTGSSNEVETEQRPPAAGTCFGRRSGDRPRGAPTAPVVSGQL